MAMVINRHSSVSVNPLQAFIKLGPKVYFGPETASLPPLITNLGPELILMFTWMGASPKNIAKYAAEYRSLYPKAAILLIMTSVVDIVFRRITTLSTRMQAAVAAVTPYITDAENEGRKPRILVVAFSNGGSFTFTTFAREFRKQHAGVRLPLSALILDSSPDRGEYNRAVAAVWISGRKNPFLGPFTLVMLHLVFGSIWAFHHALGKEDRIQRAYRELNESGLVLDMIPRLYLYSKADQIVDWEEVEQHADTARMSGDAQVEKVVFEGSEHVFHVKEDKVKYWNAVRRCWNASQVVNACEMK